EDGLAAAARQASAVFHMAAQVAVTTSMVEPRDDFDINVRGTLHLLDALRLSGRRIPLIFASTNKVYGDLADVEFRLEGGAYRPAEPEIRAHGISEQRPLDFHTPYGCSKGAADQYVLDYARSFGLPTAVLRMSCIYGERQMGTEDQGWVAHFLIRALEGKTITLYGDGHQVRDVLWIDDLVRAMRLAMERIDTVTGQVFNVGGGERNSVSVRGVIDRLQEITGVDAHVTMADWRPGDQRIYVSDTARIEKVLGWRAETSWKAGLEKLVAWLDEAKLDTTLPLLDVGGEVMSASVRGV
ncbi:MAG TPA: GDP-mannose 4,6-dehydratase, partial [Longimicrobium sp.]